MTTLIIVESPTKAKTIQKFLGSDYIVKASMGHIRDLDNKMHHFGIDVDNAFKPHYIISKEKAGKVKELRESYKSCNNVILASDEDREGEAIAWHISDVLRLKTPKRIVFHEITKKAIDTALKNPRTINMNMVHSQETRCILDKLVGFELSPLLWRYIEGKLSAGRVQSVVVRLIIDKEAEIEKFQMSPYFKVNGLFNIFTTLNKHLENKIIVNEFLDKCKTAIFKVESMDKTLKKRNPSPPFITSSLQQEAGKCLHMSAKQIMGLAQKLYEGGYITYHRTDCTLLSEQIMSEIKKYITTQYGDKYVHLRQYTTKAKNAQEAHEAIRPTDINKISLPDVSDVENKLYMMIWKRTVASQMKACEIDVYTATISISNREEKFIGKSEEVVFDGYMKIYNYKDESENENEEEGGINNLKIIKNMKVSDELKYNEIIAKESFTKPPPRYTESSLNKRMEVLGIGRPSTYASIINTVQERGYIEKKTVPGKKIDILNISLKNGSINEFTTKLTVESDKNKLFPTEIGIKTNSFLIENFGNILDYKFTSKMEEELDNIACGNKIWNIVLKEFYDSFHPIVDKLMTSKSGGAGTNGTDLGELNGIKVLLNKGKYGLYLVHGDKKYPVKGKQAVNSIEDVKNIIDNAYPHDLGEYNGKKVLLKDGKYGLYIDYDGKKYSIKENIGEKTPEPNDSNKSNDSNELNENKKEESNELKESNKKTKKESKEELEEITLEDAIRIITTGYPKNIGDYNNIPILLKDGKFGIYFEYNGKNYQIKDKSNINDFNVEMAVKIIEETNSKVIKNINATIKIMNGPYGPYIHFGGKKFVSIPKDIDPTTLSLQDCKKIEEQSKLKKKTYTNINKTNVSKTNKNNKK